MVSSLLWRRPSHQKTTPTTPGWGVIYWFLIFDSLESIDINGIPVMETDQRVKARIPNHSGQCVNWLTRYLPPSARWLPTPIPPCPERKQLQAGHHIIWHGSKGKEENVTEQVTLSWVTHWSWARWQPLVTWVNSQGHPGQPAVCPRVGLLCLLSSCYLLRNDAALDSLLTLSLSFLLSKIR